MSPCCSTSSSARSCTPSTAIAKSDEIPFDFLRRRLSVVLDRDDGKHILICKGAVEEVFAVCSRYETADERGDLDPSHLETAQRESARLNADGFRVIAVAYKELADPKDGLRRRRRDAT